VVVKAPASNPRDNPPSSGTRGTFRFGGISISTVAEYRHSFFEATKEGKNLRHDRPEPLYPTYAQDCRPSIVVRVILK